MTPHQNFWDPYLVKLLLYVVNENITPLPWHFNLCPPVVWSVPFPFSEAKFSVGSFFSSPAITALSCHKTFDDYSKIFCAWLIVFDMGAANQISGLILGVVNKWPHHQFIKWAKKAVPKITFWHLFLFFGNFTYRINFLCIVSSFWLTPCHPKSSDCHNLAKISQAPNR